MQLMEHPADIAVVIKYPFFEITELETAVAVSFRINFVFLPLNGRNTQFENNEDSQKSYHLSINGRLEKEIKWFLKKNTNLKP